MFSQFFFHRFVTLCRMVRGGLQHCLLISDGKFVSVVYRVTMELMHRYPSLPGSNMWFSLLNLVWFYTE